ncbi:MAG: AF1514 family protein [Acidobacteriota bacterium]
MAKCPTLTKEMLNAPVELNVGGGGLDYYRAREIADTKAREMSAAPMLLAWYDRVSGERSPKVESCNSKKPGWLVYAESRGGNIAIDINNEDYVFVYMG